MNNVLYGIIILVDKSFMLTDFVQIKTVIMTPSRGNTSIGWPLV